MSDAILLNQNLETKMTNRFYVKFLGIDSNYGNFLAAHLVSIDRPIINFDVTETFEKMRRSQHVANVRFNPIGLMFKDDVGSLVFNLLYDIAKKQNAHTMPEFDIVIDTLDSEYKLVDSMTLQRSFFQTIGKTPLAYNDSTESLIDVTINFESVCFNTIVPL